MGISYIALLVKSDYRGRAHTASMIAQLTSLESQFTLIQNRFRRRAYPVDGCLIEFEMPAHQSTFKYYNHETGRLSRVPVTLIKTLTISCLTVICPIGTVGTILTTASSHRKFEWQHCMLQYTFKHFMDWSAPRAFKIYQILYVII